jgi:hypothetical protein
LPALLSAAILAITSFPRKCNRYIDSKGNKSVLYCQRGCNIDLILWLEMRYCGHNYIEAMCNSVASVQ